MVQGGAPQKINLILLGDGSVGKTSMIKMYSEKKFTDSHMATLGLDFVSKTYKPAGQDKEMQVKIWDTAGQERFRTLTLSFYKQAHGVIIAFDVTNEASFNNVLTWIESIQLHAPANVAMILVGNKCDLTDARVISNQQAKDLAKKNNNMNYYDVSAKANMNINEVFEDLMNQVYKIKNLGPSVAERVTVTLQPDTIDKETGAVKKDKKSCGC